MTASINSYYDDSLNIAFYRRVFISSGKSLSYTKVNVSVKFWAKPTKAFSGNRRMGYMFSFNSSFIWSIASERKEKKKDQKMVISSLGRCECWFQSEQVAVVWRHAWIWITCDVYFIQRQRGRLQQLIHMKLGYLWFLPTCKTWTGLTQPIKGVRGNNITDCSRYLILPQWCTE